MEDIIKKLSLSLNLKESQIKAVLDLLNSNATIPFIARYRKEVTGALDENQIREISKEWEYQNNLLKRKEDVIRLIDEKGLLTDELKNKINLCQKLIEVEDLYMPFKEKKKTKATIAKSLGMEPLAKFILTEPQKGNKESLVKPYLNDFVKDINGAINYAKDIIAEQISDNANYRKIIRNNMHRVCNIVTKKKRGYSEENSVYENYFDYTESITTIKDHRILAINRAEKENAISVSLSADDKSNIEYLTKKMIYRENIFEDDIKEAVIDSYNRLIEPSIEREIRNELTLRAENSAINLFGLNLRSLLLQPPLKNKTVLGVDPAFRTGCKLAVVDKTGKMLEIAVIRPTEEYPGAHVKESVLKESKDIFERICKKYNVDIIAIGNGTASRETEEFVANTIKERNINAKYIIVSEAGASVYSASKIAQEEFPDLTLEKRSAVSIARRIQDPLAELVKIEPKSIGVGQYQHDVNEKALDEKLSEVVVDAVNNVGANLNTASESLLSYISGLNKTIAKNIVTYRNEHGKFNSREELNNVSKLGPKTYEQCVGFLRVYEGFEELDETSIHPESYDIAKKVLKYLDINVKDLGKNIAIEKVSKANAKQLAEMYNSDIYTISDILSAIEKPQRDIRDEFNAPILKSSQTKLEDLNIGDELEGTVRNVVDFGAFVDVGLHDDGLVHISKMSNKYLKHPSDIVKVGDIVKVYVSSIDLKKHKLQLAMVKEKI